MLESLPLLNITTTDNAKHTAYAYDISCAGKLRNILTWLNKLNTFSPKMGYFPKAKKLWLIVKDASLNITSESKRYLGAVVGTEEFRKEYVIMRVNEWVAGLKLQTKIAKFYPQAAYCTFTSGFRQKFKSSTEFYDNLLRNLRSKMTPAQLKTNDIATSDSASIWLSSLPLKQERFSLTKRKFFDAILVRYGWEHKRLPHEYVCKAKYNIDHALTCKTIGFVTLRHTEIINVTADILFMVCEEIRKEPTLRTTADNSDELRADISVRSFWQKLQTALVDIRIFYPFAPSYRNQSLTTTMKTKKTEKKKFLAGKYGSFIPLVITTNGGMSTETKQFYRQLSELLCEKSGVSYSNTSA